MKTLALALALIALPALAADPADALKKADLDFAAMAKDKGAREAFKHFAAPDAVTFGGQFEPLKGPEAISSAFADQAVNLEWRPLAAQIADSGDLGFTWGRWRQIVPAKDGAEPRTIYGKYVTIWHKQKDGSWRFVLDTGNPNPPPPEGVPALP